METIQNAMYQFTHTLLKATEVRLVYQGQDVLKPINLELFNVSRVGVEQGDVIAILGPSGSGKTRLCRLIAGLDKPTSGTITIGAEATPAAPGLVGFVFQDYYLIKNRTVWGNLMLAAKMGGYSRTEAEEMANGYLETFELMKYKSFYPIELSGGTRQRVAIVQQLLCSKHFIIMDEPVSGLDPRMVKRTRDVILKVTSMHDLNTIIMVTHDIRSALKVADRIILMGCDYDESGKKIPGARIQEEINTIDLGLAWNPENHRLPLFNELVASLEDRFETL